MVFCPSEVFKYFSSSGVVMNPSSMRQLGIDVSLRTRNPAWWTPLFTLPLIAHTSPCMSFAKSTLFAMFLSCMSSNMM